MAEDNGSVRHFFGTLLVVVGGLMAALCGSCGAFFFLAGMANLKDSQGYGQTSVILSLIMGGVPALIGLALFAWGRRLRAGAVRPSLPQANFDSLD